MGAAPAVLQSAKGLNWYYQHDGFYVGPGGRARDLYFQGGDDAIHLYDSNQEWLRLTINQLSNGMPFMFGWGNDNFFLQQSINQIMVSGAWVINDDRKYDLIAEQDNCGSDMGNNRCAR